MKAKTIGEIPRIEKSFREFHPHLDVSQPLELKFITALPVEDEATDTQSTTKIDEIADDSDVVPYSLENFKVTPELASLGYSMEFALPTTHYLRNDPVANPKFPEKVLPGDFRGIPCRQDNLEFVEYDMDEQDLGFLGFLLSEYKVAITAEIFEVVMSMLELESYKINLNMKPKSGRLQMIDETQQCVICNEADVDNTNSIVYCDGCDIAVHQECYGVPFIPEGQWLCKRCKLNQQGGWTTCLYCPHRSGAFTRTKEGQWAHTLCALWIPELKIDNAAHMDSIVGTDKIPRDRWRLNCSICQRKQGACIQCAYGDCITAFHPTCGQAAGLSMTFIHGIAGALADYTTMVAFCPRHTPPDAPVLVDFALVRKTLELEASEAQKAKETEQKLYPEWRTTKGALYVPRIVMETVRKNIQRRFGVDLQPAIPSLCRYWTLKRDFVGGMFSKRLVEALDASRQEFYAAETNAYDLNLEKQKLEELFNLAIKVRRNLTGRASRRK